jgi:hypothetical protein
MNQDLSYAAVTSDTIDFVNEYCDDCQYKSTSYLTLEDLDYIAQELDIEFDALVTIIREHF